MHFKIIWVDIVVDLHLQVALTSSWTTCFYNLCCCLKSTLDQHLTLCGADLTFCYFPFLFGELGNLNLKVSNWTERYGLALKKKATSLALQLQGVLYYISVDYFDQFCTHLPSAWFHIVDLLFFMYLLNWTASIYSFMGGPVAFSIWRRSSLMFVYIDRIGPA